MNFRYPHLPALLLLLMACQPNKPTAMEIVNNCIQAHGGELYEHSVIDFDFRGRHYKLERNRGQFAYHRTFTDSTGIYHDILRNSSFERTIQDSIVELDDQWIGRYSNSVNSVAYFALLPFGLNDPAVHQQLLADEEIRGKWYFKIRVTFSQEGGGEDFEDVFVYWINKETFLVEYFGYSYLTEGGGIRFREAINQREVGGIIFSDYMNYEGAKANTDVEGLAQKFLSNELSKLSEIFLENLEVGRIK
jgi:hypothetical protein